MARRSRCIVPGMAYPITQGGVNRRETFSSDEDREAFLGLMAQNLADSEVRILGLGRTIPLGAVTPTGQSWFNNNADNNNNRVTGFGYDLAGNQTAAGGGHFIYDAENRQTKVTLDAPASGTFIYVYDGEGRRVRRTVYGSERTYVYSATGQTVAEYQSVPLTQASITSLPAIRINGNTRPWDVGAMYGANHQHLDTNGYGGSAAPVVFASGLREGAQVVVPSVSGRVAWTNVGNNTWLWALPNGDMGSQYNTLNGYYFPSHYAAANTLGIAALVGAWTDSNGIVVKVEPVGAGGTFTCPAGATQFQLGINRVNNYDSWDGGTSGSYFQIDQPSIVLPAGYIPPQGQLQKEFIYLGGRLLAVELAAWRGEAASTEYITTDHLGSMRLVTDGSGNVKSRHDYLPFGKEVPLEYSNRASVPGYGAEERVLQRFTGKELDPETGLDYFGARYFSGRQGRFTTVDPIMVTTARLQDPQTLNLYAYVRNNPLALTDPDGQALQVSSGATDEEKKDIDWRLKQLAPGTHVNDQGQVQAPGSIRRALNWLAGSGAGTSVVTALVNSEQTTTIVPVGGNTAGTTAVDSSGQPTGFNLSAPTDARVSIDLNGSFSAPTRTGGANSGVSDQPASGTVVLGHELIHAFHITNGTLGAGASTQVQHTFRVGTQVFGETWFSEEFRTVGFTPFVQKGPTENAIRHQLGLPARAAYLPQTDWTQLGSH